jgi:hypothetical protein
MDQCFGLLFTQVAVVEPKECSSEHNESRKDIEGHAQKFCNCYYHATVALAVMVRAEQDLNGRRVQRSATDLRPTEPAIVEARVFAAQ